MTGEWTHDIPNEPVWYLRATRVDCCALCKYSSRDESGHVEAIDWPIIFYVDDDGICRRFRPRTPTTHSSVSAPAPKPP